MSVNSFVLVCTSSLKINEAQHLASELQITLRTTADEAQHFLVMDDAGLHIEMDGLRYLPELVAGRSGYRRAHGGGMKEPLVKACGIKKGELCVVLDATAGWLRDSMVLANAGAMVIAVEQHRIVHALMRAALQQAQAQHPDLGFLKNMTLFNERSEQYLNRQAKNSGVDVVYLDPMYPPREKSALVKKEMQILQKLAEAGSGDELLLPALSAARKKVVVKRPDYAPPLAQKKPNHIVECGAHRFDVYLTG